MIKNKLIGNKNVNNYFFGYKNMKKTVFLYLVSKRKNLFFSFTDLNGNLIKSVSLGCFNSRNKRKKISIQVVEFMMRKLIKSIDFLGKNFEVSIVLKLRLYYIISVVVRILRELNFRVLDFVNRIPVPHNGCRLKKLRRL